jgi:hypothetical protein
VCSPHPSVILDLITSRCARQSKYDEQFCIVPTCMHRREYKMLLYRTFHELKKDLNLTVCPRAGLKHRRQ